jgi:hypothetical protein
MQKRQNSEFETINKGLKGCLKIIPNSTPPLVPPQRRRTFDFSPSFGEPVPNISGGLGVGINLNKRTKSHFSYKKRIKYQLLQILISF